MLPFLQVGVILALELTLLPALHGCWVDICLLPLTASTLADRLLWFSVSPVSFLLAHWTLGMAMLMASATFMSIFCQQLRPGQGCSIYRAVMPDTLIMLRVVRKTRRDSLHCSPRFNSPPLGAQLALGRCTCLNAALWKRLLASTVIAMLAELACIAKSLKHRVGCRGGVIVQCVYISADVMDCGVFPVGTSLLKLQHAVQK